MSQKCSANKKDGLVCRAWAVRDSDPPLCSAHSKLVVTLGEKRPPPQRESVYKSTYTVEEVAQLLHLAIDHSLDDELTAARVAVRRVLNQLKDELTPAEYARLASVIFTGANTISRLVRTSHELADKRADEVMAALVKVLHEHAQARADL